LKTLLCNTVICFAFISGLFFSADALACKNGKKICYQKRERKCSNKKWTVPFPSKPCFCKLGNTACIYGRIYKCTKVMGSPSLGTQGKRCKGGKVIPQCKGAETKCHKFKVWKCLRGIWQPQGKTCGKPKPPPAGKECQPNKAQCKNRLMYRCNNGRWVKYSPARQCGLCVRGRTRSKCVDGYKKVCGSFGIWYDAKGNNTTCGWRRFKGGRCSKKWERRCYDKVAFICFKGRWAKDNSKAKLKCK